MKETRKKIGEVSFGYEIRVNGNVVKEGKTWEPLWLRQWVDPDYMPPKPRQELFFTIRDYPIVAEWVVRKLGSSWHRRYECHWNLSYVRITGTGDVIKRFRELVRRGWVREPERARARLIAALLLEESDEESSGSTLHARVPA